MTVSDVKALIRSRMDTLLLDYISYLIKKLPCAGAYRSRENLLFFRVKKQILHFDFAGH